MFRNNQYVLDDEIAFYAHILRKKLVGGTTADIGTDEFICCELRDRWTRLYPEIMLAWEKHKEARLAYRKVYDAIEEEALRLYRPREPLNE